MLATIYTYRTKKINKPFQATTLLLVIIFLSSIPNIQLDIANIQDLVTCLQDRTVVDHSCNLSTNPALITDFLLSIALILPLIVFAFILFTKSPALAPSPSINKVLLGTLNPLLLIIFLFSFAFQAYQIESLTAQAVSVHNTFLDKHRLSK
jgi:hypothetical protein